MRRYLIVDDNRAFAENLAEILRDEGDEVSVATGGPAALELARQTRFDALVTDMRMPVMGGATLVHLIRRIDPAVPAIVVTAYTGDDDLFAARQEGLLAVLPKPVPIPRLIELLKVARRDALVAIVEDDLALADNLSELLRERGYGTVTATSVVETERLGPVTPFVALVDLRVPEGAPGEAMRRLGGRFPGLPMYVISAYHDPPPVAAAAHFQKPFDAGQILARLDELHRARAGRT